jgi:hypothetical protein
MKRIALEHICIRRASIERWKEERRRRKGGVVRG